MAPRESSGSLIKYVTPTDAHFLQTSATHFKSDALKIGQPRPDIRDCRRPALGMTLCIHVRWRSAFAAWRVGLTGCPARPVWPFHRRALAHVDIIALVREKVVDSADALGVGVVFLAGGEDLGDVPHGPLREHLQGLPECLA
jgi:hypothetical protein